MKILVTGGAGYIGSHTVVELFAAGHTPVIVDDLSNSHEWIIDRIAEISGKKPLFYKGDCTDMKFLSDVFVKESSIDGAIHFAAFKAVGESIEKPLEYYRNNINSLLTLLDVAVENNMHNIVFSSSATVYGEPESNPITEDAPRQEATCPYGNTKSIAEDILRDTTVAYPQIHAIALRYFNPIGAHPSGRIGELPNGVPNNLVPYVTQAAAGKRDELTVFGDDYATPDGTCMRDFIHVVDLAQAHIRTLEYLQEQSKNAKHYDYINIGTGTGTSVLDLLTTFKKVNKIAVPYKIGPRRAGDIKKCWANATKAKKLLNWQAKLTVADALKDAWRWEQSL